jgi:acylphosphatase
MNKRRVHLRVRGLVQGVSFRASARHEALRLGLAGIVRNLADGDVEVVAEGEKDSVDVFVAWCHHGPSEARVASVQVTAGQSTGEFSSFQVVR